MPVATSNTGPKQPPPKYHEPVQGTVFHGDGREEALLKHLQSLPELSADQTGDLSLYDKSQRVLDAIHEFGKADNRYLMSVGETKGRQVEEVLRKHKAKLVLELGSYVGYSGISFGRHIVDMHPDAVYPAHWSDDYIENRAGYVSLEKSDVYAATAQGAFNLAGLGNVMKIVVGSSTPNLRDLRKTLNMPAPLKFDVVFLDHLKPLYTIDLKVMEEEGLVGPGTVLIADNVVKPGNPPYLSYVRATPALRRAALDKPALTSAPAPTPNPTIGEGQNEDDVWAQAFRDGPIDETRWPPAEAEGITAKGDPGLMYTSEMLDGWDPYTGEKDACEVSVCTGRE